MSHAAFSIRPPLRAPARWPQAVRAELAVLREARVLRWAWLIPLFAFEGMMAAVEPDRPAFRGVRFLVAVMFFFPLAWQGEGGGPRRSTPLPMDGVALELVRLACGALCAALVLGTGIASYAAVLGWTGDAPGTSGVGGFPVWYPLALFTLGMAHYLFGSALALQSESPGRLLVIGFILGMLALAVSGIGMETVEHQREWNEDRSLTWTSTTTLTLASALLRLALAGGAVALSVAAARSRSPARWRLANPLRGRAAATRRRPRAGALRVPRPPASLAAVASRQFAVQAPRMTVPLLLAAFLAWGMRRAEMMAGGNTPEFVRDFGDLGFGMMYVASLWPVLVWMDERHDGWEGARPAGTVTRRLVHAGAGLAWLQIHVLLPLGGCVWGAVAAGSLRSPLDVPAYLWLGLPLATAAIYSLGTFPVVLAERPVLAGIVCSITLPLALFGIDALFRPGPEFDAPMLPLSPSRVFAPMGWVSPGAWSIGVALLWTPVFLGIGAGAIWLRAWRER